MERTNHISGSAATRGCSAVCRFLKQVGAQVLGVPELAEAVTSAPWWGEASSIARYSAGEAQMSGSSTKPRQVEFWVDNDLKIPAERKLDEAKAAPVVDEPKVEEKKVMPASRLNTVRVPEKVILTKTVQPVSKKKRGGARLDRGAVKSVLGVTRFLSINGSLSSGREGGRWLALPGRRNVPRYKLMQMPGGAPVGVNEIRSLPRNFGGFASR